jgi:hypothetical protein
MSELLILMAGLPGSGKTTRLDKMREEGWRVFDDYKADGTGSFQSSARFNELICALGEGSRCVVADIDFCNTDARNQAESIVRGKIPGLDFGWEFFANDRSACEANIRARNRPSLERELECLAKYSPSYNVPEGAGALPVWRGP